MGSLIGNRNDSVVQGAGFLQNSASVVQQLEERLKTCIKSRDYAKAERLETQLQVVKQQHERQALEILSAQQAEERAAHEVSFNQARQELALRWQGHMTGLQEQLMVAQQQMLVRHEQETATLLAAQLSVPARPKASPQLLNMRHIERTLADQKHFAKADKVKQQAGQQELIELQCFDADRLSRWEAERAALAAQHGREQQAADKKVTSALMEAQLSQQQELEQLTRRFQAAQLAMERSHAAQQLRSAVTVRSALGLSKPSTLLSLTSFNTSLAPPRSLVPAPPATPAHACRPGPLFQDTLSPAPPPGSHQLVPTMTSGTTSACGTRPGTCSAACCTSLSRGTSPARSQRVQAYYGSQARPAAESWRGAGILGAVGCSSPRGTKTALASCQWSVGACSCSSSSSSSTNERFSSPSRNAQISAWQAGSGPGSRGCSPARGVVQLPRRISGSSSNVPVSSPARGSSPQRSKSPPSRLGTAASNSRGVIAADKVAAAQARVQAQVCGSSSSSSSSPRSCTPSRRAAGRLVPLPAAAAAPAVVLAPAGPAAAGLCRTGTAVAGDLTWLLQQPPQPQQQDACGSDHAPLVAEHATACVSGEPQPSAVPGLPLQQLQSPQQPQEPSLLMLEAATAHQIPSELSAQQQEWVGHTMQGLAAMIDSLEHSTTEVVGAAAVDSDGGLMAGHCRSSSHSSAGQGCSQAHEGLHKEQEQEQEHSDQQCQEQQHEEQGRAQEHQEQKQEQSQEQEREQSQEQEQQQEQEQETQDQQHHEQEHQEHHSAGLESGVPDSSTSVAGPLDQESF